MLHFSPAMRIALNESLRDIRSEYQRQDRSCVAAKLQKLAEIDAKLPEFEKTEERCSDARVYAEIRKHREKQRSNRR